jgi:hypothetical protein
VSVHEKPQGLEQSFWYSPSALQALLLAKRLVSGLAVVMV